MPPIKFKIAKDNAITPIPNSFIDIYVPKSNPSYTAVYIYAYRKCFHGAADFSVKNIADAFDIFESDVLKAFSFWEQQGLIKTESHKDEISIEFLDIDKPKKNEAHEAKNSAKKASSAVQAVDEPIDKAEDNIEEAQAVYNGGNRPTYSPKEINLYIENNESVRQLIKSAESALGKYLNYTDMSILFGLHDWLKLPVEVIEFLVKHCVSSGHKSMNYIERAAVNWCERGVTDLETAKQHIKLYNKDFRTIMKAFGIKNRDPIEAEEAYMTKWLNIFELPIELVAEACKKTVLNTSQPSFPYADQIITNWTEKGIKTLSELKKLDDDYKASKKASPKKETTKQNKFVNFEQRNDRDFEEIERLESEFLDRDLEGYEPSRAVK